MWKIGWDTVVSGGFIRDKKTFPRLILTHFSVQSNASYASRLTIHGHWVPLTLILKHDTMGISCGR